MIGATGLVGSQLLRQLMADEKCKSIVVLGRRSVEIVSPKLVEHVIDFAKPDTWAALVEGEVAFSGLGTTLKVAGSEAAQWQVDNTFQLAFGKAAAANGVPAFVLISSSGATAASPFFYLRMKGELERDLATLPFVRQRYLRPGVLDGERVNKRLSERFFVTAFRPFARIFPAGMRPIAASVVADAAVRAGYDTTPGIHVLEAADIFASVSTHTS
ncbi:MAG: NAD(P)H-binding protein [Clostridia bacterium]|nr:NAD(P)H-binding protein [Deltaproteobacteria bacterium]